VAAPAGTPKVAAVATAAGKSKPRSSISPNPQDPVSSSKMRGEPIPAPPGWKMQVFEVVPALSIATRLDSSSEYGTLDVDVIVDLEDWEAAWAPPVPLGRLYVSFPMDDGDEVDPNVRELAVFIASLVTSGRRCSSTAQRGSTDRASSWLER
jgi:hypothetical protein